MARGDLSDFYSAISESGAESKRQRDNWNKNNPPLEESTITDEDGEHTVGIWIGADGILSFSFKMTNGKYNPYAMIRVPHAVYNFIREQEEVK